MELNLDSAISLSSARLFQKDIDFIYTSLAKNNPGHKQPAKLQNHTCKNKWLQRFSTTFLDFYTHAAPMPKNSTHWKHQQMRWKFTLTRSCPKQRHKDFNTIPLMEMCKDFTRVFKLWDKIKILIVAFLQTYFILNILLPCSSVSSFICPSESCAALVVHDLTSPCFELVLTVLIRWMLHFQCVKTTVRCFWLAMRTDAFSVLKALLRSYTLEILHM